MVVLSDAHLTPRQAAILDLVACGETNVQIARALGISATTVATHLRAAYIALHARNRVVAAVAWRCRGCGGAETASLT